MKMSDVFDPRCKVIGITMSGPIEWVREGKVAREYATHAINSHDELVEENDQLKAQISVLLEAIQPLVSLEQNIEDIKREFPSSNLIVTNETRDAVNKTPASCLAEIEASAVLYAMQMVYHEEDDHRGYYSHEGLRLHVDYLRQQAKEAKV